MGQTPKLSTRQDSMRLATNDGDTPKILLSSSYNYRKLTQRIGNRGRSKR